MKLKKMLVPAMATCSLILAHPAWAQSNGPASGSVIAEASIVESQLRLEILSSGILGFSEVTRPNGVVSGAQCRYTITPDNNFEAVLSVSEIRNGQVFDAAFPTASGCESMNTSFAEVPVFTVRCTPATPVTIRAEWASEGRQGATLTGNSQGVFSILADGRQQIFPVNVINNSAITCPENANPDNQSFNVFLGGTLTLDADADLSFNAKVGTVTLNATY
jgi:hypothetical protein